MLQSYLNSIQGAIGYEGIIFTGAPTSVPADTLNLSLTDVETEKFVGNYRCDILCKDEITGKVVLIENQLESTNHDHLGKITKAEIIEAIRRGAVTVDGVKRRVGSGMGRCQGSRCTYAIEKLLEEIGHGTL